MKVVLQHATLQWLLHLGCGSLAILMGPWPLLRWLLLLFYLACQTRAARWLERDVEVGWLPSPWLAGTLAHAPGLVLAIVLLGEFLGLSDVPNLLMVHLQWWTGAWTPLLARLPPGGKRNLYLWVTLAIPFVEWALLVRGSPVRVGPGQASAQPGVAPG